LAQVAALGEQEVAKILEGFNRLSVRGEFSSSLKGVPNAGWNGSRNMRILSLNSTKRTHGTHAQMVI